jgi:hypothetical protein
MFSVIQYIMINLACLILGADKVAFEERIELVKLSKTKLNSLIKEIKDPDDKALALMAYQQILEAKAGVIHTPCLMDWCSSGASILSAIMRDKIGMCSCGVLDANGKSSKTPGNLYQVVTNCLNETYGTSFTRLQVKGATLAFYYGGDKNVSDLMEGDEDKIQFYHRTYESCLPGAYAFRQAALDAWNSDAASYPFMAPDGYEIEVPVLGDSKAQHVTFSYPTVGDDGARYNIQGNADVHFKVQEARPKYILSYRKLIRNNHTKGLGAHMIHALDAYILREIVRISKMPRARAIGILREKLDPITTTQGYLEGDSLAYTKEIENAVKAWEMMGVINTRILHLVADAKGVYQIPMQMYQQLQELVERLPEREFDVVHIHDEFGALPQFMNDLRRAANTVYANLYRGNVIQYYNSVFGMKLEAGEYDPELYKTLLEVDYLLS